MLAVCFTAAVLSICIVVSVLTVCGMDPILAVVTVDRRRRNQVVLERVDDKLQSTGDLQLIKDRGQVMPDGRFGDEQLVRNVLVLHPFANKFYDLMFAIGQSACSGYLRAFIHPTLLFDELSDRVTHDRPVKPDFAVADPIDRLEERIGAALFRYQPADSETKAFLIDLNVVMAY